MRFKSATAALAGVLLLAGCAGATIGLRSTVPPSMQGAPPSGGSYNSAAIHAEASPNAYFSLLFLGYIAAGIQDNYPGLSYGPGWRKSPPLAEDRAIIERDCSRPMDAPSANLRCR
jgi:hypothetical protein